jgi:hypothetical protein
MGIGNAVRHRAVLDGYNSCTCRYCAPSGTSARRWIKRKTSRSVRRNERREVQEAAAE